MSGPVDSSNSIPNWRQYQADKRLTFFFDPGTRYSYSGEGYALLQMVIEEITGRERETLALEGPLPDIGGVRHAQRGEDLLQHHHRECQPCSRQRFHRAGTGSADGRLR